MTGHRVTSRLLVLRDRRLYRVHLLTAVERISTFCSASDNEMCSGRHRKSHKQPSALKTDTKPNMRNLIILSLFCLCSARFIETTLHRQESCETVRSKRYYAQPSCQLYGPVTVLFNVSGGGDTITLTRVTDSPLNPITGPCQTTHDREISITTLGLHRCSGNYSFAPNETFATVDEIPLQYGNESVVIGFYTDSACTTVRISVHPHSDPRSWDSSKLKMPNATPPCMASTNVSRSTMTLSIGGCVEMDCQSCRKASFHFLPSHLLPMFQDLQGPHLLRRKAVPTSFFPLCS